jgi:ParB-like chromosome segregation protein Spo0J
MGTKAKKVVEISAKAKKAAKPDLAAQIAAFTVEDWPIDRPIAYARNSRKIPQAAIDKVAASIKEFGWRQPIVVDADDVIVVGHTRLFAARKLGKQTVPVHVARDLTPAQIKAYRLADNRVAEETDWDKELLHVELSELAEDFSNLDAITGFDLKEIQDLLGYKEEAPDAHELGDEPAYNQKWMVLIECANEAEQVEMLERLMAEGVNCKAMNG